MITKQIALYIGHGITLHNTVMKNRDGTPVRCRVNGKCKTWKRRPDVFLLPVKYGLRDCFYIEPHNAAEWEWPNLVAHLARAVGLTEDAPAGIVRDKLMEEGDDRASMLDHLVFPTRSPLTFRPSGETQC